MKAKRDVYNVRMSKKEREVIEYIAENEEEFASVILRQMISKSCKEYLASLSDKEAEKFDNWTAERNQNSEVK